ncbi:MAG: flagellar basal body P-ring protein FlgI [Planctomycetia bacterium]|nr:flagellar basal body P-ring protein FlgI [Planctomycetia bacterium]
MSKKNWITIILLCVAVTASACNKVPKESKNPVYEEQQKVLKNKGRLVGDLVAPSNTHLAKVEGVTLIRGLAETGANEPPSLYQQMVLKDLQRDVDRKAKAKEEIASLSTAIVLLKTVVPPGAQKGDRLDIDVTLPERSEATSLEGGYIEPTNLHQYLTKETMHVGEKLGVASGFVLPDSEWLNGTKKEGVRQGKIIGGAMVTKSRPVWLSIPREEDRTAGVAQRLEDVINARFSCIRNGSKCKVAEAKYGAARINLIVPDEYKANVNRYLNVVCAISFFESPDEQADRIHRLKAKLLDPETSEYASIQLEAIGPRNPQIVEAMAAGLACSDEMVRFNCAIAVAYMNIAKYRNNAATTLAEFARSNPKLRAPSLAVLGTSLSSSFEADTKLRELLASNEPEIRYGAFRALWTRNPNDYMILGENMADQFSYHCLNCGGMPLVHLTEHKRPEIVLFSKDNIYLQGNFDVEVGSDITIRSQGSEIIVKKYRAGLDEQRIVGWRLDDVLRALVAVGGTYPDAVIFLKEIEKQQHLVAYNGVDTQKCVLAVDALPGKVDSFKRVHDIEELAMADIEKPVEKEETSVWTKMNPAHWFSSDDKEAETAEPVEESAVDSLEDLDQEQE